MSVEGNVPARRAAYRMIGIRAAAVAALAAAALGFVAGRSTGGARDLLVRPSPDRSQLAAVRDRTPCPYRSCRALRIGSSPGEATTVSALASDEQVDEISWTPDGGRVGFLVNGYQLRIFDARTGASAGAVSLLEPDGYPSSRIARGVTFSNNGAAVTFDDCARGHSGCTARIVALKSQ